MRGSWSFEGEADLGQDGDPKAIGDHLDDRGQAGGAEAGAGTAVDRLAVAEGLVAQAVPLLEQQQALLGQEPGGAVGPFGQRMQGRDREDEPIVEQADGLDLGRVERQGEHEHVEGAALQLVDDHGGLALAQAQLQRRIALLQAGQRRRQQVGGDRGDHTKPQRAGEQPGAVPGIVDKVVDLGQNMRRSARYLLALGGERNPAPAALDQRGRQARLQLLDLDRQGRLADRAFLGRAPEMPMARERGEIAQLAECRHNLILLV